MREGGLELACDRCGEERLAGGPEPEQCGIMVMGACIQTLEVGK